MFMQETHECVQEKDRVRQSLLSKHPDVVMARKNDDEINQNYEGNQTVDNKEVQN